MNQSMSDLINKWTRAAGQSPRPLARDEYENPADGDEAVLEGGHGQDGELGSILQRKDSEQPPVPGRTTGTALQERKDIYGWSLCIAHCSQGLRKAVWTFWTIFLEHL